MDQEKRSARISVLGLVVAAVAIIGLAVLTSDPFQKAMVLDEKAPAEMAAADGEPDASAEEMTAADETEAAAAAEDDTAPDEASVAASDEESAGDVAAAAKDEQPAADSTADAKACCKPGDTTPPLELVKLVPPGGLNNPYDWRKLKEEHADDPDYLVKQYRLPGCNECHGGGGGGGFCPALSQGVWFWGNTDDILFRLIAEGSQALKKQGFERYQYGLVKGPMIPMGHTMKTSDHLWRIISYIRSINPPGTNPPDKIIPGKYTPPGDSGGDAKPSDAEPE